MLLNSLKKSITAFTLLSMMMNLPGTAQMINSEAPIVIEDPEDAKRTRTATIIAGASILALIGGVAYFACGTGGKCHSSSSSSSYPSSRSSFSPYYNSSFNYDSYGSGSYGSRSGSKHHHHRAHHKHKHSHSNSSFSGSNSSFWSSSGGGPGNRQNEDFMRGRRDGNMPARLRTKNLDERDQISAQFISHPCLSGKGSFSAYIQLPDGARKTLGTLPFSPQRGSTLSSESYTKKGHYLFGIRLDSGSSLNGQTKIGTLEIKKNGVTVESRDFHLPAHASTHYEPQPIEVRL